MFLVPLVVMYDQNQMLLLTTCFCISILLFLLLKVSIARTCVTHTFSQSLFIYYYFYASLFLQIHDTFIFDFYDKLLFSVSHLVVPVQYFGQCSGCFCTSMKSTRFSIITFLAKEKLCQRLPYVLCSSTKFILINILTVTFSKRNEFVVELYFRMLSRETYGSTDNICLDFFPKIFVQY